MNAEKNSGELQVHGAKQPQLGIHNSEELLDWLRKNTSEAEGALRAREQMESTWRNGTDESCKAVDCRLTKEQRMEEADRHRRIAVKLEHELKMFKATLKTIHRLRQEVLITA